MADPTPPWERYKTAKVVDAKPATPEAGPETTPTTPASPEAAPARVNDSSLPPWEKYRNATVKSTLETDDQIHIADMASETEKHLARLSYTPPDSDTWAGWAGRIGRATTFGLSDTITAGIIKRQLKDEAPDMTYEEVLSAVREGYSKDVSMSAEVIGSLAPGVALGKLAVKGGRVAMDAASRAGVLKGSLDWLARDRLASRAVNAAAGGAGIGAVYEAVRESVDQTIGGFAGEQINPDEIRDAAVGGAVVGALLSPVANEALRGAGGIISWVKQTYGGADEQVFKASKRILSTLGEAGENPDATVMRLRQDVATFTQENGRPPALFEIIAPDKVSELADVNRFYSGLAPKMRALTDDQVERSIKTLEDAVTGTKPLRDTEAVEAFVEDRFTDVMRIHGDRLVDVGDEAFEALATNKGFLAMQAKHNPEARALLKVVEARDGIVDLRSQVNKVINTKNIASETADIAKIRLRIAEILDEAQNASGLESSELAYLTNLARLNTALTNQADKAMKAGYAEANAKNLIATLRDAETLLAKHQKDGFKVSLRTANAMRFNASRAAKNSNDLNAQAEAIGVRDAIMPIGTAEVPSYGRVVKAWNREMTRAEAHATGAQAARGTVSPENLGIRIDKGRLPGKPRAKVVDDVRKGVEEGARIDLRSSMRSEPGAAQRTADRIATAPDTQATIRKAIPGDGDKIVQSAKQTKKTVDNARIAASKMSPSELQEQASNARDEFGSFFINRMGGAGIVALATRQFMKFQIPRGTANKLVDMLGDPRKMDDALSYMIRRGIDVKAFVTILANATIDAEDKKRGK